MSGSDHDDAASLRDQLARCRRLRAFADVVDDSLEHALRERWPLERALPPLLSRVAEEAGAIGAVAYTLDESLTQEVRTFGLLQADVDIPRLAEAARTDGAWVGPDGRSGVAVALDVAGEDLGALGLVFDGEPDPDARDVLRVLGEQLDNHLATVAHARERYELIRALSDALKDPVLDRGLDQAIAILGRQVDFQHLLLLFRHEDDLEAGALSYKIFLDGELAHDSVHPVDPEVDRLLRRQAAAFLSGDDAVVRERFGISRFREEVLISGVRTTRVVGRLLATSRQGEFHTLDRELLDRFADYLRQRIVDFNREWKTLSGIFADRVCERLLREEGYTERYLTPQVGEVAVLFGDISGFTRISEQVLRTPEAIGRLIHIWSDGAVDTIWETGGVFDKMVGDCVIGLWGPPFFEDSPAESCRRALAAAVRLRAYTRALASHPDLPELHGLADPPAVSVGVHFCKVSVGFFGPNADYTGFSSGMNNCARLQGVARKGEILAMEDLVEALGDRTPFGELRTAEVKNVAEPLRFRALADGFPSG
ncbi:MAG: adenylate/guanylate cyclase domain-containing protein [Sandaracinaceae bacterium]